MLGFNEIYVCCVCLALKYTYSIAYSVFICIQHIVTHRPTARQSPQHTRGQQCRSSVFYVPRTDRCYAARTRHVLAYAVTSHNSGERVYSVKRGPCRVYIGQTYSEARSCRSTEKSREWQYNGLQRSTTE
jgi:hypothetical protein